jgi:hypothetical protein
MFITISQDGRLPLSSGMPLLQRTHHQRCNRQLLPEMISLVDRIGMAEATLRFTILLTIAPVRPLMFCTRLAACKRQTLRTSFGNMGIKGRGGGSPFTPRGVTSFSSLPASGLILGGEMAATDRIGQCTAVRLMDTCCDILPGFERSGSEVVEWRSVVSER